MMVEICSDTKARRIGIADTDTPARIQWLCCQIVGSAAPQASRSGREDRPVAPGCSERHNTQHRTALSGFTTMTRRMILGQLSIQDDARLSAARDSSAHLAPERSCVS